MSTRNVSTPSSRESGVGAPRLGDRLRQLRVAAGLTQSDVAGERFSKEYVSQIERGKTRPTRETIEWLADRLGVDAGFLANGVATDERGRLEGALARAEALIGGERDEEAVSELEDLLPTVRSTGIPELRYRALLAYGRALARVGEPRRALDPLLEARGLAESAGFSDLERAEVLYVLGGCRVKLNSIQTALGLLNEALALAERSGMPCDSLRANILSWRARCWRRTRDYVAAREDIEAALELANGVEDSRTVGAAYFQASLIADREGHWMLARSYAEKARQAYDELSDRSNVAQLTNNLGAFNFLLGNTDEAVKLLKEAFGIALELGNEAEAALAVSSLAQVHLRTGRVQEAEEQARVAAKLLLGREEYLQEFGNVQLVLGRALLEQERLDEAEEAFRLADTSFERSESPSHRAAVWVARGDVAAHRGDDGAAATLYRSAAEALQDFRF